MASDSPAALEAVLRRSELARTNNFDLLQDAGYEALRVELAADFPYLTLADLNAIIKLGIKGKLDTYKARTLNFTRIYQWVEQRAVFSVGYWRAKYPALLEWADMVGVTNQLVVEIDSYQTPAAAFNLPHKFRALLQSVVRRHYYPQLGNDYHPMAFAESYPEQALVYRQIESDHYQKYLERYPEDAKEHTQLF